VAQDEYYYEIQLTNKQLVFYFMAGASGLVLSFLAGIMVGRGVDASAEVQASARPPYEDRIIAEEPPAVKSAAPAAEELGYSHRLESSKAEDPSLSGAAAKPVKPAKVDVAKPTPVPTAVEVVPPKPAAPATALPPTTTPRRAEAAKPTAAPAAETASGTFSIQVGAFKDKAIAESLAKKLKKQGFTAYVVTPGGGLFNVRVGSFPARAAAEKVQERLSLYNPFIVKQ
jgi:cell division septation protein DedD